MNFILVAVKQLAKLFIPDRGCLLVKFSYLEKTHTRDLRFYTLTMLYLTLSILELEFLI